MMTLKEKLRYAALYGLGCVILYKLIQFATPVFHQKLHIFILPGEENIPFVPAMLPVYLSMYLIPPMLLFLVQKRRQVFRILKVFSVATLVHFAFFIIVPVEYVLRPALVEAHANPFLTGLSWMYALDEPFNNFPSMHVSFAFLSYFCLKRYRPVLANLFLGIALLISLSTLFIKQHYVADVLAAILLAMAVNYAFLLRRRAIRPEVNSST